MLFLNKGQNLEEVLINRLPKQGKRFSLSFILSIFVLNVIKRNLLFQGNNYYHDCILQL